MALINTKNIDSDEFSKIIRKHKGTDGKRAEIKNVKISSFSFPIDKIKNISFSNSKWENINASNKILENIKFHNCELTNLNFRNIKLINVTFDNCKLKNVVMNKSKLREVSFINSHLSSTDPNIDNNYLELDVDILTFKNSTLKNIGFYKSKGVFVFDDSNLNDVSGQSLKSGSALHFNSTDAFDIDFSRSNLTKLEIYNSTIKQSKTNNCSIGKLVLENSILDFPISQGSEYENVISKNTGNVVISGTPTKSVKISGCPNDTRIIMVGGDTFDNIEIENCNPDEIIFFESTGKFISIENADVYTMDFSASKIDHLKLKNIHIKTQLYYDSSNIKKLEARNITFGENIEHTHEDSNIEIKADNR